MGPIRPSGAYPARYGPGLLVFFLLVGVPFVAWVILREGFTGQTLFLAGVVVAALLALWPARRETV